MSDYSDTEDRSSDPSFEPSENESISSDNYTTNEDDIDEDPLQGQQTESQSSTVVRENAEIGSSDGESSMLQPNHEDDPSREPVNQSKQRPRVNRPQQAATSSSARRQRRTVYCFFCEQPVLQFARHLIRHHPLELEVQRILVLKKKLKKRKRLISVLRNKGNYLRAVATNTLTPVRKPALNRANREPLPCTYCYGLFARKQLWRHVRQCPAKTVNEAPSNYQNIAQNLLLSQVQGDDYLIKNVFPRMRADKVTLAVKADPLICAFGSRFAKTHRVSHQVNFVSRRMRELGRLIIELKRRHPHIQSLTDALKPEHYNKLVESTKAIAGCDDGSQQYKSPTLAMNMQTTLKECCEVACNFLYQHANYPNKNAHEEAEFPFRRLTATITANWKFDVSHDAAHSLNTAMMNKVTIVPLASDLQKLRRYLTECSVDSVNILNIDGTDVQAYKNLTETIYCRVMLLCRKRPGELSRLTVELYNKSGERHSYEEFADVIRPSEMLLVRKFKRVVIHGKRKPTPVIFTDDVQSHIQTLLKVRRNFLNENNPYLFGNPNTTNPIPGYKVIKRHALRASLSRPEAITTRCLRKHLATVCQLLSMTDQDIEQLAAFMGHGVGVHRSEYRLPDDVFQVAKVAKLLMMMESGRAAQFKGKTLDEIELDMDEDVIIEAEQDLQHDTETPNDDIDKEYIDCTITDSASVATPSRSPAVTSASKVGSQPKKFERALWSDEQKRIARLFFEQHIKNRIAPRREECEELLAAHPEIFKNRSWQKIKVHIVNEYTKKRLTF